MPHINDLTPGVLWEGNNGEKWITGDGSFGENEILPKLTKLKVEEKIVRNGELQELIKEN